MTLSKKVFTINLYMFDNKYTRYINIIVPNSHLNNR